MWKKCRKKPIVVEFREVIVNDRICVKVKTREKVKLHEIPDGKVHWINVEKIETREGELYGFPNEDYIIRGVRGEIYPIGKDIFYETYDVIEE